MGLDVPSIALFGPAYDVSLVGIPGQPHYCGYCLVFLQGCGFGTFVSAKAYPHGGLCD